MRKVGWWLLGVLGVLVIAAVLFPVFAKAKAGPTLEEHIAKNRRMERERRLHQWAQQRAWDAEKGGDASRAEGILREAYGHTMSRRQDEGTGQALLHLLIRSEKWAEAAGHFRGTRHGDSWDVLRQYDLYIAARQPPLAKAWAGPRTEPQLVERSITQARNWKNSGLEKSFQRRRALIPITPAAARADLLRNARQALGTRPEVFPSRLQ